MDSFLLRECAKTLGVFTEEEKVLLRKDLMVVCVCGKIGGKIFLLYFCCGEGKP